MGGNAIHDKYCSMGHCSFTPAPPPPVQSQIPLLSRPKLCMEDKIYRATVNTNTILKATSNDTNKNRTKKIQNKNAPALVLSTACGGTARHQPQQKRLPPLLRKPPFVCLSLYLQLGRRQARDDSIVSTVGGDKLLLSLEYSLLALFLLDPFIKKEFPRTLHGSGHFSRARSGQGGPTRSDPTREISNIS